MTYSISQAFEYIANENDKRMFIKKETVIAITVNIKSKIYKINLLA